MSIELQKPTLDKTHVMRGFFISEFEKDLENKGVDTVCFMGYGYDIKEVKVGAEFYFSYLYYGRMLDMRNGTKEECLRSVLLFEKHNGNDKFFDRYKILQKFKYFDCSFLDTINRKVVPIKQRREYVKIKNLRTNEITVMSEDTIGYSHLFCWVSW
jgi:hypothetical protein